MQLGMIGVGRMGGEYGPLVDPRWYQVVVYSARAESEKNSPGIKGILA